MKSVKKLAKISKQCTECFKPVYLKFNFSYITYEKNFDEKYQIQFLKRMRELSIDTYMVLSSKGKELGYEHESVNINKKLHNDFESRFPKEAATKKFHIVRLYPNDNPICARIIGKIISKVFYVFYIDIGGSLYSH